MESRYSGLSPSSRAARAFTLIELLTVIAIIAVLAAILFPIFGTVREQARQSNTLSNLHSVYMFARSYYEDEGHYPSTLFGYAEIHDANTNTDRFFTDGDNSANVTPFSQINKGYLFHEHSKDSVTFTNADNLVKDPKAITQVYWPLSITNNAPIKVTWRAAAGINDPCPTYAEPDLPAGYGGNAKYFYLMDSMDIGPMLDENGRQLSVNGAPAYELHYTPDWTSKLGSYCDVDGNKKPVVNQLKYKNPPTDRTVITYVTQHAATTGSPSVIVLLASGTARKVSYMKANADQNTAQLPLNY